MILFPSKLHDTLNYRTHDVDKRFGRAMFNVHYQNVTAHPDAEILVDCGAFQKKDMINRLTPEAAFKRQRQFEFDRRREGGRPWRYMHYDCLRGVDEAIVDKDGKAERIKRRGNDDEAAPAVALTIEAAEYYAKRAADVEGGIAFSAQGSSLGQYMYCVSALLDLIRPGKDWLALGGFCIIGNHLSLIPQFHRTVEKVAPLAKRKGIEQVHVLGVFKPGALVPAARTFRRYGIKFSTDTSGVEQQSIFGKKWDVENLSDFTGRRRGGAYRKAYEKHHKHNAMTPTPPGHYNPCELLMENLEKAIAWASPL